MRKQLHRLAVASGAMLSAAVASSNLHLAQARPQYFKAFVDEYPHVKDAKTVKCGVCHPELSKKVRNAYGAAIDQHLGMKNEKDADKTREALLTTEKDKSNIKGKTFGDLLKEGKLPDPKE